MSSITGGGSRGHLAPRAGSGQYRRGVDWKEVRTFLLFRQRSTVIRLLCDLELEVFTVSMDSR